MLRNHFVSQCCFSFQMNDQLRAQEFWAAINCNSVDFCASTWNIPENPLIPKALPVDSVHIKVSEKLHLDNLAHAQRVVCRDGSIVQLPQCNCDGVTVRSHHAEPDLRNELPLPAVASHFISLPLRHVPLIPCQTLAISRLPVAHFRRSWGWIHRADF
jgi:hypothetical protein